MAPDRTAAVIASAPVLGGIRVINLLTRCACEMTNDPVTDTCGRHRTCRLLIPLMVFMTWAGQLWAKPVELGYQILQTSPHDTRIFTQGLLVQGDTLVETSGLYGQSFIIRYDQHTGAQRQFKRFPARYFAEGVAGYQGHLYVLTWKAGVLMQLDEQSLAVVGTRQYDGEGWGLTHNNRHFIVSNGSDRLQFRDLKTFKSVRELRVVDPDRTWENLNELEFADGLIWANVWQSSNILAIDPEDGRVRGILNLSRLSDVNNTRPGDSVLNGIAYNPATGTYWVTGKLWPNRYEIRIQWPETSRPENINVTKDGAS